MSTHTIVVGMTVAVAILNLATSILVAVSSVLTRSQKTFQLVLIWLLPLLGAIGTGLFISVQGNLRPLRTNKVGAKDLDAYAANLPGTTQSQI